MAFSGGTQIIFCNVPIDNSYKHQFTFSSQSQQETYFANKKLYEKENYLMVHRTNETKNRQYMRVYLSLDDVRKCNYCAYFNQSADLAINDKWIYAFITDYYYKSDEVTEIEIEVDVWNTYQKDISIKHCLIEREHTNDDTIGNNVVPENLELGEYITNEKHNVSQLNEWCLLLGSTVFFEENYPPTLAERQDRKITALAYYAYDIAFDVGSNDALLALQTDLDNLNSAGKINAIQFMILFPRYFILDSNTWSTTQRNYITLRHSYIMQYAIQYNSALNFSSPSGLAHYVPKNNKLYTYPYCVLYVTNNQGNYAELKHERFTGDKKLELMTVICSEPKISCFPLNYNNENSNTEQGLILSNFPNCDWSYNTVLNWYANNSMQLALNSISNLLQIGGGIALSGTGAGALTGAAQISSGILGLGGVFSEIHSANIQPPQAKGNTSGATLNNRMFLLNYSIYNKTISYAYARIIDNYFTKYGYKTFRLKTPNITGRKFWNYVKTNDCIISGNIANDEKNKIMQMFNDGVTFWHYANDGSTTDFHVGDYSLQNDIV